MDPQTLRKFHEGDEHTFSRIMQEYQQPLYYYIYKMVGNGEDARDILQETFVKAYTKRESFRGDSQVNTWLYSIAGNLAKNHLRWRSIRRFVTLGPDEYELPAEELSPDEIDAMKAELLRYLDHLPRRQRSVFLLKYYHGLSHREVAAILDISEASSKTNFHYATKTLREVVKEEKQ